MNYTTQLICKICNAKAEPLAKNKEYITQCMGCGEYIDQEGNPLQEVIKK